MFGMHFSLGFCDFIHLQQFKSIPDTIYNIYSSLFIIIFVFVKFIDFDCDFTISYIDSTKVVEKNHSILIAILRFSILLFPFDLKQKPDLKYLGHNQY